MSAILKELMVTQRDFAAYLGIEEGLVGRWADGHDPIPRYAEIILMGAIHANHLIMHIKEDFLIPDKASLGRQGRFDRNAYQREYMRKWRAAKKSQKPEEEIV